MVPVICVNDQGECDGKTQQQIPGPFVMPVVTMVVSIPGDISPGVPAIVMHICSVAVTSVNHSTPNDHP
jgi:hypothetical protein|tara:strand:- start:10 stop:216 length:207 start_codon:yes stop_codon:yes gene_type:complete